ncbi:MAG: adenylate/guanylate cyclase domain-containing protein [Bacteroidetes bacterium]|nr:MAG: adenylate/guanylate cyclase domain-containing protein [Bacteroidota bacterium]
MNKKLMKTMFGILFAVVSVALTTGLFQWEFFRSLELKAYDAMLTARGVREHTSNVVIIKIDEFTMKELDYPIPRDKYGTLLAILAQSGAKAVGVDDLFPTVKQDSVSLAQNEQFLLFHNYAPNVYHAIGPFIPLDDNPGEPRHTDREAYATLHPHSIPANGRRLNFPQATYIDERPFDSLASLAAGVGHVLLSPDPIDGIIRAVPFFVEFSGDYYPTFGAALAFAAAGVDLSTVTVEETETGMTVHAPVGASGRTLEIPLTTEGDLEIDYVGGNDNFTQVSLQDVLDAFVRQDAAFLAKFKDAVVIIGPTARSIGDHNATPIADISPNCFVHANVYDQIMMGRYITHAPAGTQLLVLMVLALIVSIAAILLKLRWSVPIGVVLTAGYLWFAFSTFTNTGEVYTLIEPLFALFFCYASAMSYTAATEGRQKAMIKGMFEKYVDRAVVQQIIDNPSLVKLGGEEREITTVFADIEGFTSMAEKMGPQNTVGMLNSYLTEMTSIMIEEYGTIDKYIGDAIMAFWGAPLEDKDHAYHACAAAIKMQRKLTALHTKWIHYGRPVVNQRIGINTGKAVVGNMGAEARLNYTAIGDAVNLASRLEGVNKEYGTRLLMSDNTYRQVHDRVLSREMDLVVVVGKTEPVRIYELIALADEVQTDATKKFLEYYHNGLEAYKKRAWRSAVDQFNQALSIRKDDIVSNLYIQRSMLFVDNPPPEDWNGVFVMTKK